MKYRKAANALVILLLAWGCASTNVSDREKYSGAQLPKPNQILVYDFATTPDAVAPDSGIAGKTGEPATPPTAEQIELEKKIGAQLAEELAADIRDMGLAASRATSASTAQVNDVLIRGYLVSVDEGSAMKRVTLGFGSGASELKTLVEGYQMTAGGPRKLGQGSIDAGGGKLPGGALGAATLLLTRSPIGLAVQAGVQGYGELSGSAEIQGRVKAVAKEIADQLRIRFKEEGWIR